MKKTPNHGRRGGQGGPLLEAAANILINITTDW